MENGKRSMRHPGLWLLVSAIIFGAFVTPVTAQVTRLDSVVAIVDDDIILASEVAERFNQIKETATSRGLDLPDDATVMQEALDRLILESIQLQLAELYGIRIPDAELDESMTRVASRNGLSLEQFRQALIQSGQDYVQMRQSLRRDLAIQRVQQGNVMRNINITEKEIDNFMATEEGLAMTEPQYRVIQALLPVTSSDTAEQKRQKEEFVDSVLAGILAGTAFEEAVSISGPYQFGGGDLGWRKLSDIPSMFSDIVPSLAKGATGKVQSASGFHLVHLADSRGIERLVEQTEVRHILISPNEVLDDTAAQALALELRQRANDGENFAELAKEYSDDIGSAQEGGALGWTVPGQMVPEFEAAMASAEIGVITDAVRSEFGWHILEVTGRRTTDFSEELKRNQIANYIRDIKYEEELENWLGKIREEAFVDIK